jgi:hypothetical protein
MQVSTHIELGDLMVRTTSNRGFTPSEIADRALNKILHIDDSIAPEIKAQAVLFQEQIRLVLEHYMNEMVKSDRTTLAAKFRAAGFPELIDLLEV